MKTAVIEAKGKRLSTIATRVDERLEDGKDVVVNFGRNANPERVLESINLLVGKYDVELVVRHAGFKEYFQNTLAGGAIGAALGAIAALLAGGPATLALVLKAAGIGAVAGSLIGGGLTQLQQITVYKYRGETRIKLACAT